MLLYYNGNCIKFNNSLTIIFQFYIIILDYDWKGENIGRKRDFSCGHKKMHTTASQIRQDLNNFGGFGQQGYGYNVKYLYTEIGKILGLEEDHNIIIIGAGNLGQALANYAAFENRGFILKGIFDVNPRLQGVSIRGVPIRMMDDLKTFVQNNEIDIAVLTIPKEKAIEVANMLVENGVRAIWNFAHTDLNLPDNVVVENVHLSESLMQLSYNISRYKEDHK